MSTLKIISEIGINHNGDFRKIEELIRQSAIGGAAIRFSKSFR